MSRKEPTKVERINKLYKELDALWSAVVRLRDGHCQMWDAGAICPRTEKLTAHHWFKQKARSLALRWNVNNGVALCYYHHIRCVHQFSTYEWLGPLFLRMTNIVGQAAIDAMMALQEVKGDLTEEQLVERKKELEEHLNALHEQVRPS